MVGSAGQQRVPRSFFDEFLVANFDPDEQSTLAKILDTLDTAIHETEAIIAKLKAVKQGLLHDLLTRGIDANGELRPPQAEAPHLYKTSRVGLIPKTWELRGVLDVAPEDRQSILTGPFGADLGQSDFRPEGVPVLRIGNVQSGFIDWSDTQYVTQHKANSLAKYLIQEGDLLFARQGATTGRNALADARADGAVINYHIIRVAVDKARCHPSYLYAVFNSDNTKSQVDQVKGRGTREGINSAQIAALSFALPQPEEQLEAVKRMASIDESIRSESALRANLLLQKISLMDDLLTGRVRVTPLLEAAE
ncbi:restriction endonuclease subunit S [Desulfomicrobium escambiense]|uniref:restriction endonuclease subunit S n=1 Tax=Desulfomicrobium escambiense TaxID=29503 RepID=UPI00146FC563|nr:restriction endonuclease subunit S [Desulfomicrobium escambiense]